PLSSTPATPTPATSTLSLHDALPICCGRNTIAAPVLEPLQHKGEMPDRRASLVHRRREACGMREHQLSHVLPRHADQLCNLGKRSEEHTSELQSRENLVCRLLLEKKK